MLARSVDRVWAGGDYRGRTPLVVRAHTRARHTSRGNGKGNLAVVTMSNEFSFGQPPAQTSDERRGQRGVERDRCL